MAGLTTTRKDAIPGFFARQLEQIEAQVQEVEYGELAFADGQVVPLEIQNLPGVRTTTYTQITGVGRFKLHRSYSTDIPNINILMREFSQRVHKWAGKYDFSDDDIEAAQFVGFPVEQQVVATVREAAMQEMNTLMALGERSVRMPGLLNHPDVLRSYSPSTFDANSTSNQILEVLNDAVTQIITTTRRVERPDTLFLPDSQYNYIATRRLDNTLDTTILRHFLDSSPYIQNVEPLLECEGAGPDGEDVMLIMRRDPAKLKAMIFQDFEFKEAVRKGLGFERPATFKYAGIRLYRPFSVHLVIGI